MKKLIAMICFTLLLVSCLGITTFAKPAATLSEDYQTLTIGTETYTRVNATVIASEYYEEDYTVVALSETQKGTIRSVSFEHDENEILMIADIVFTDGATMSISYLKTEYLEEYQKATSGQAKDYLIDFEYPSNNVVAATGFDLHVEDVFLTRDKVEEGEVYSVYVESKDQELKVQSGFLLAYDDAYFYVSFYENEISDYGELMVCSQVKAHKITNEALVSKLGDAQTTYYAEDLGLLVNDDLGEKIATVFLTIAFGVIPFVIFVLFLILAIRSKSIYKKMFRMIYGLAAAVLVVSLLVAVVII